MKRIQCLGVGQPCPAYWYHEGPGRPHKRCPRCEERRRWVALERLEYCVCGKLLIHPKVGRPRVACSDRCARRRRKIANLAFY